MSLEDPGQTSRDSHFLYQLCCDVGFSPPQLKRRLQISDVMNTCLSYTGRLPGKLRYTSLHSGSQSEGVGMNFLGSDTDVMGILSGTAVIEGNNIPLNETDHMFQIIPTPNSAIVNVQLLSIGRTNDSDILVTPRHCDLDIEGRLLLNGSQIKDIISNEITTINGPALRVRVQDQDLDIVVSLHCRSWPSVSREWITRERRFNWPHQELIKQIVDNGCELVATGTPGRPDSPFDWRLFSSMAEKLLIRTFNIYQIQCYFLLKLILVFRIKTLVQNGMASYHMKTVMLYVVETTNPAEWRENNLTNCFMICLRKLHSCLQSGNCPQYFITQQNLFYHKVQGVVLRKLQAIVTDLVSEGWKCVMRCPPFNKVNLPCHHIEKRCPCHLIYWQQMIVGNIVNHLLTPLSFLYRSVNDILSHFNGTREEFIFSLRLLNDAHESKANHFNSKECIHMVQSYLNCSIGLCLIREEDAQLSERVDTESYNLTAARELFQEGSNSPSATYKLKFATLLYLIKEFDRCIDLLRETLRWYDTGMIPYSENISRRIEIGSNTDYDFRLLQRADQCTDVKMIFSHITLPVVFSRWEIPACPPVIQRVVETRELVTEYDHQYSSLLFIDPLVYIHFLRVICYRDLDQPEDSRRSLEKLRHIVQNPNQYYIFYPDIARLVFQFLEQ